MTLDVSLIQVVLGNISLDPDHGLYLSNYRVFYVIKAFSGISINSKHIKAN